MHLKLISYIVPGLLTVTALSLGCGQMRNGEIEREVKPRLADESHYPPTIQRDYHIRDGSDAFAADFSMDDTRHPQITKQRREPMLAKTPEEICYLFKQYMAEGNLDAVLSVYDPEAVIVNRAGEVKKGADGLRQQLAPLAAAKATFNFTIKQVVQSGNIALMHTEWKVSTPQQQMSTYAIEVARRQLDGTWRWLIGDPFTIGRQAAP
jgi:ketosteroid isomerase-like protein